jgi:hypothetical protein
VVGAVTVARYIAHAHRYGVELVAETAMRDRTVDPADLVVLEAVLREVDGRWRPPPAWPATGPGQPMPFPQLAEPARRPATAPEEASRG